MLIQQASTMCRCLHGTALDYFRDSTLSLHSFRRYLKTYLFTRS